MIHFQSAFEHLLQVLVVDVVGQPIGADDDPVAGLQDAVVDAGLDVGLNERGLMKRVGLGGRIHQDQCSNCKLQSVTRALQVRH